MARKILLALVVGIGGGVFFFGVISLLTILLPWTKNDSFIIGCAAVFVGIVTVASILASSPHQ